MTCNQNRIEIKDLVERLLELCKVEEMLEAGRLRYQSLRLR